jgi:hypothetical protein
MQASKYNIISKVKDSENYFIVNLLSQEADIITKEESEELLKFNGSINKDFVKRGYIVDPEDESRAFKQRYLEFIDARDTDEIQLFLCQPMHAILLARIAIRMSMVPSIRSYRTNCLRHFSPILINDLQAGKNTLRYLVESHCLILLSIKNISKLCC